MSFHLRVRPLAAGALMTASSFVLGGCGGGVGNNNPKVPSQVVQAAMARSFGKTTSVASRMLENYHIVHRFAGRPNDGGHPVAPVLAVNGTLFGTTMGGGTLGQGAVFKISAGVEKVIYSFTDFPFSVGGLTADVNGTLYGTTTGGGTMNSGTIFQITPSGEESVLYNFTDGSDGGHPDSGPGLLDVNGTLYGTTSAGGAHMSGTVFRFTPPGTESVLYSFAGGSDGNEPNAGLIDIDGTLYGTTQLGGFTSSPCGNLQFGCGTVFKINTSGSGYTQLYRFKSGSDGAVPLAGLTAVGGMLYGTTVAGGANRCNGSSVCGTVFKISPSGSGYMQLHKFRGGTDGNAPYASLTDVDGVLYGTTAGGGAKGCDGGCGTVFKITTAGKETILHDFAGGSLGVGAPIAGLIYFNGALYGTAYGVTSVNGGTVRGSCKCGVVYSLNP